MNQKKKEYYLQMLRKETVPAMGCTEPAAAALCAAGASAQLPGRPERLVLEASGYILKNAMNVGIPGTDEMGLETACAMGAAVAAPEKSLLVLEGMSQEQKSFAKCLVEQGRVAVLKAETNEKVFLKVTAFCGEHTGQAVISDKHGEFSCIVRDSKTVFDRRKENVDRPALVRETYTCSVQEIWDFAVSVGSQELAFLDEAINLNSAIAREGLQREYGLQVGKSVWKGVEIGILGGDLSNRAVAVAAAAADARMSGCEKAVMSVAGSGNQGLTATLPIIAVAEGNPMVAREQVRRALAISILVTVHAKHYIGRLSVLCGCSIAAAIGVVCGVIYLFGGGYTQAELGIKTMTADISGMICDGAKPGCALKIATSVSAAMRASVMALSGIGADNHDGIVGLDVEQTLKNLGELGTAGMADTNTVILDMLLKKQCVAE